MSIKANNFKLFRKKSGFTQEEVAEKLGVSRQAVAKWENGLGLPNPESMAALEKLFDIVAEELATKEPEGVIVKKNRKLRWIGWIVAWSTILVLFIAMSYLPFESITSHSRATGRMTNIGLICKGLNL